MATQTRVQVGTSQTGRQNKLAKNIHQTILALDSELSMPVDGRYRERLVKAAYALRSLEESIQRDRKLAKHSRNSEVGRRRAPV